MTAAKHSAVILCTVGDLWLQLWLENRCKNTGHYSIFQLLLLLLLNNYQYKCNNTISSLNTVHLFPRTFLIMLHQLFIVEDQITILFVPISSMSNKGILYISLRDISKQEVNNNSCCIWIHSNTAMRS